MSNEKDRQLQSWVWALYQYQINKDDASVIPDRSVTEAPFEAHKIASAFLYLRRILQLQMSKSRVFTIDTGLREAFELVGALIEGHDEHPIFSYVSGLKSEQMRGRVASKLMLQATAVAAYRHGGAGKNGFLVAKSIFSKLEMSLKYTTLRDWDKDFKARNDMLPEAIKSDATKPGVKTVDFFFEMAERAKAQPVIS